MGGNYNFDGTPINIKVAEPYYFDIDGDGHTDALTDGLLLLRYMFGFRGDTLITGVLSPNATRVDVFSIEQHIMDSGNVFDVDGNGTVDALTDGVLTLRYIFGFRGLTLIDSLIGNGATRSTAIEIETYLQLYVP